MSKTYGWTHDRVQVLTDGWSQGLSARAIAGKLGGVTRNAVIGKAHRLGLSSCNESADPSEPQNYIERDIRRIANEAADYVGAVSSQTRKPVICAVSFALRKVMSTEFTPTPSIDVDAVFEKLKAVSMASRSASVGETSHGG